MSASSNSPALPHELVLEPGSGTGQYWRDVWNYRELFYFLAWRDLLVRYKQTVAGVAWALLRPFMTMIVFTVVFGKFAKLPAGGVPYPVLVFAAVLPWQFFATALAESSHSLVTNSNLVAKIYFPRLIVPASTVVTGLADLLISTVFLLGLMLGYHVTPTWRLFVLPVLVLSVAGAALGLGLWFAALTVKYRDFRFIVPFVVQLGYFISPVGYSSAVVPEPWRDLYSLNPLAGIIESFRWAICGGAVFPLTGLLTAALLVTLLLVSGLWYFRKTERAFADVI